MNTALTDYAAGLFENWTGLQSADLSGLDTSGVTSMNSMFYKCSSLSTLNLSGKFKTAKVTSMQFMFGGCSSLSSLDVSGFDTSNVEKMGSMFFECKGLTALDVSGFNTSKVTYMTSMFNGCSGLTALDVSGFDTSSVAYMEYMFFKCANLTALDLSGFKTSNLEGTAYMFTGCTGLKTLNLSSFGPMSKLSYYDGMVSAFQGGVLTPAVPSTCLMIVPEDMNADVKNQLNGYVVVNPGEYAPAAGAGQTWTKGGQDGLQFTFKRDANDEYTFDPLFQGVQVDDTDTDQFTAAQGSAVITLKPAYLDILAAGSHTLKALFLDGAAEISFTVANATATATPAAATAVPAVTQIPSQAGAGYTETASQAHSWAVPKTGDDSPLALWAAMAVFGAAGVIALVWTGKRKKGN